jgi:hypothetical protein
MASIWHRAEETLKKLDLNSTTRFLVVTMIFGFTSLISEMASASFVQGGNTRALSRNGAGTQSGLVTSPKKKRRFNIDFSKKSQDSGRLSEMNEKILEAETDLKSASNPNSKKSVVSNTTSQTSNMTVGFKDNSVGSSQKIAIQNPPVSSIDTTVSSSKIEAKEQTSAFGMTLMLAKSREVEMPEEGGYSNDTTYIFLPRYKINENYSTGMKFIGVVDHNDSKETGLKSGSANISRSAMDINEYLTYSPALVGGFPVNSKQRDVDSFLGAAQGNVTIATKKDALGDLALVGILGATKSFYEYSTQLNLDPEADDTYNSNYSVYESIAADYPLFGDFSFSFSLTSKQAWDFEGEQKQSYDMTETLNWQVSKVFTLFGGLENEEVVKASEGDLNYRFYNSATSTYVLGISIGI